MDSLTWMSAGQFDVNRPYGNFLPRPPQQFTMGSFGPMTPIQPIGIDIPRDDSGRPDPRRSQYPISWNLPVGEPGSEGVKLAPFGVLRALTDTYSVARSCVDKRVNEIVSMGWDIVPTDDAELKMKGDPDAREDWEKRRRQAVEFFKRPDSDTGRYPTMTAWLSALLEDRFVVDAVAVHLRPSRKKGAGPFGSDLASLDLLDGTTIRPLLNLAGATPTGGSVAYQQYIWGVPRTDLISVITERDMEVFEQLGELGQPVKTFVSDQLIYLRETPRDWTPYGMSCVEKALLPISIGLARQQYQSDYFTEGSVPAQWITPGPDISTPTQIRQLQDALNAMAGDIGAKHRIIVLPPGSKADPQKPFPLADQFDEWILSQVTMPFMLTPMDMGVTPRVSAVQSPSESRELSQINNDKGSQTRTEPVLVDLKDNLFDFVLHEIMKQLDMEWSWGLTSQGDRRDEEIQQHIDLTGAGLESIDEARVELGKTPWGLPETSLPGTRTATGFVSLAQAVTADTEPDTAPPQAADAPTATPEQPDQPHPRQADSQPTTPAHEAAQSAPTSAGAAAEKSLQAELQILERYLRKGRDPARFRSTIIPPDAVRAAGGVLGKGIPAAVDLARSITAARRHQQRRATHLQDATVQVASGLGQLVHDWRKGKISHPQVIDAGVQVMAAGYRRAMAAASADALAQVPGVDSTINVAAAARQRGEGQRGYLMGLLTDVVAGLAAGALAYRLTQYAMTLLGAYNSAFGDTVKATGKQYQIVWHLGAAEHCSNCIDRDGKVFTFDDLPGYPGDGEFGGGGGPAPMCLGGPNCHCSLEYREGGRSLATGENTQRPGSVSYYQSQLENITAARQAAQDAREEFLSGIPEDAAGRAMDRDQIRQEMAAQANQRIRDSGGYPGVSVEPGDILADRVADILEQQGVVTGRQMYPPPAKAAEPDLSKQDLTAKVYAYLAKVYPADTLGWVKKADWRYDPTVLLTDIDMDRRPGGRDHKKVAAIAHAIADGMRMDPVVLVDTGDPHDLQVADGYHRTLAHRHAKEKTIRAYVATGVGEHGPWEREMHDKKLNKTASKEDT